MRHLAFITLLAAAGVSGCTQQAPTSSQGIPWPSLIDYPCTVGRAATSNDLIAGRAAFVMGDERQPIAQPLSVTVPQYAFYIDAEHKQRTPCVIIQAEEAFGLRLIGCRTLPDGQIKTAELHKFELLGTNSGATK